MEQNSETQTGNQEKEKTYSESSNEENEDKKGSTSIISNGSAKSPKNKKQKTKEKEESSIKKVKTKKHQKKKMLKSIKKNKKIVEAKDEEDESKKDSKEVNGKKNNDDFIIEIEEKEEVDVSSISDKKKKIKKKEKGKKKQKNENQSIKGYSAFSFFEKEKFKERNCQEGNARDYVKQISLQWKNMTAEEKEPYEKMVLEYKKNNNCFQDSEKKKFNGKKRKRNTKTDADGDGDDDCDDDGDVVVDSNDKDNGNCENGGEAKIKSTFDLNEIKSKFSPLKKKMKSINFSVCGNNEKNNVDKGKTSEIGNHEDDVNEYICSVLVPFVNVSYELFKGIGIIKSN